MKITLLILHITCAILFGVAAVTASHPLASSLYTLSAMAWSVCVGMDITQLIYKF